MAIWSYLSLVTHEIIQHAQFLSAHLCRCFVINYSGSQAWYCNAKYLPYPLSNPLGQGKSLINTACISSTCITHISWVFAAWKNAAWPKTTVIRGQLEIMSLLAEKSWHLDSIFFFPKRGKRHNGMDHSRHIFWVITHKLNAKKLAESKRKTGFLEEAASGQPFSFQVCSLLSEKFQCSLHLLFISCNIFFHSRYFF